MARVLVTGAGGLIGSRLVARLASEGGHAVTGLVRRRRRDAIPGVTWQPTDLRDPDWTQHLPPGVDSVIHLAQSRHFRDFPDQAQDVFEVNVASTARLLDWAYRSGVRRFVLGSSGGLYGSSEHSLTEDNAVQPGAPLGYYLATKHCAELLTEAYSPSFIVVILRFFFVYGAGQNETMLLPRLVRSVREGHPLRLAGQDGIQINPIHVSDAVEAVAACLKLTESQKINVAGPEVQSLRAIGELIGERVGRAPEFVVDADTAPQHLVGDITRMRWLLGAPGVALAEGLDELIGAPAAGRGATC